MKSSSNKNVAIMCSFEGDRTCTLQLCLGVSTNRERQGGERAGRKIRTMGLHGRQKAQLMKPSTTKIEACNDIIAVSTLEYLNRFRSRLT